jgi:acetoacetyl-CoA reductase
MSKVAIVTGGTRGIGKEISLKLIADGFDVAAIYAGNDKAAKAFKDETGASVYKVDVANLQACIEVVEKISKKQGDIAVLVNNAGITRDGMLHKMPSDDWHSVIETNLTSVYNMCRAITPAWADKLFGGKGWNDRLYQGFGFGRCAQKHHR